MKQPEIVTMLRVMADFHSVMSNHLIGREQPTDAKRHKSFSETAKEAADLLDRGSQQPEWLSQALNEGDGSYKP